MVLGRLCRNSFLEENNSPSLDSYGFLVALHLGVSVPDILPVHIENSCLLVPGEQIREVTIEGGSEAWRILLNMDHIEANSILVGINKKNKRNGLNRNKEKAMEEMKLGTH